MGVLAGTRSQRRGQPATGRWIMVPSDVTAPPRRRARVIQRRRRTFERILALAVLTFFIGIVPSMRWMWFVHLGVDAALGLYVWRLIRLKRSDEPAHLDEQDAASFRGRAVPYDDAGTPVFAPEAGRLVKTG